MKMGRTKSKMKTESDWWLPSNTLDNQKLLPKIFVNGLLYSDTKEYVFRTILLTRTI